MPRAKPNSCNGCTIVGHGSDFSAIEGTGANGVMLVGEASGEHEQRDCLPFRPWAPAGALLQRVLHRMGLAREQFSITNVVRCRPRNNWLEKSPWEYAAINACRPNLDAAIAERRPRAIVALGGIATRELTGEAGPQRGVSHLAGYVLPSRTDSKWPPVAQAALEHLGLADPSSRPVPVVPTFHPAFLRRGKASHQGIFARSIARAVNIAAGRDHDYLWNVVPSDSSTWGGLRYACHPSLADAQGFAAYVAGHSGLPVSYDLETDESSSLDEDAREGFADTHIRLVQFAVDGAGAIAVPWEPGFIEVAQAILQSPNAKVGHNVWLFDNKVLRAAGEREGIDLQPRGVVHDTLAMYHHWQPDLPAHLQFAAQFVQFPFPWKHLAATGIEFYGCCDVDATLRLYGFLEAALRKEGLWDDGMAVAA